jgi:hypothetical protein
MCVGSEFVAYEDTVKQYRQAPCRQVGYGRRGLRFEQEKIDEKGAGEGDLVPRVSSSSLPYIVLSTYHPFLAVPVMLLLVIEGLYNGDDRITDEREGGD